VSDKKILREGYSPEVSPSCCRYVLATIYNMSKNKEIKFVGQPDFWINLQGFQQYLSNAKPGCFGITCANTMELTNSRFAVSTSRFLPFLRLPTPDQIRKSQYPFLPERSERVFGDLLFE